ncbi:hypothetical protein JXD38_05895 [candidate division WOR-3 bacterium]|nr:hypothetical protein [candidate division WOR-3 bacterium]
MHRATGRYWRCYRRLPGKAREHADKAFTLLRQNPRHPSLRFKPAGKFWSVRIDMAHRALAVADGENFIWVWIGPHGEYDRLIRGR